MRAHKKIQRPHGAHSEPPLPRGPSTLSVLFCSVLGTQHDSLQTLRAMLAVRGSERSFRTYTAAMRMDVATATPRK